MNLKSSSIIFFLVLTFSLINAQPNIQYKITVAQDGSGDFTTIQSAVEATTAFPEQQITIFIKNGIYLEKVRVPSWNNLLSFIGENAEYNNTGAGPATGNRVKWAHRLSEKKSKKTYTGKHFG